MKTLKKALSIILGVAMILSCVAGMQISASAEGNTLALKVGTATVVDGVVTVPVVVDANAGFQSLAVTVSYDDAVLDLVSAEKNAKFAGDLGDSAVVGPTDANPFKMMWAYALTTENVTATGTIATLTFNVVEGATAESTNITLNVTEAWDVAKDDVAATTTAGTVDLVKECAHEYGALEYSLVEGICYTKRTCTACGEVEPIAEVNNTTITPNPVLASGLAIRFRIVKTSVSDYTDIYGVFSKDVYDSTTGTTYVGKSEEIIINAANQNKNWQFEYTGIASYEMTCNIYMDIYGTDANGNVVLLARDTQSLADFFRGRLIAGGYSEANMNLYADILRYGAEAQKAMSNYNGNDLANDLGVDANGEKITTTYGSELPTTFTDTTPVETGSVTITPAIVVGNTLKFRLRVAKADVASISEENLKITVTYKNASGVETTDVGMVGDGTLIAQGSGGKNWQFEFANLPCAEIAKPFTVRVMDGENEIASLEYCFQAYASSRYTSGAANATLCQAIIAYSNSARTVFYA